jgi:hypothetical protein
MSAGIETVDRPATEAEIDRELSRLSPRNQKDCQRQGGQS